MSGVAGRSGRKAFVPDPAQRNMVRKLTGWGIPQQHICRVVTNPQTGKPLDPKSLRKHFALEIGTGAVEANFTVGRLILATILGSPPPPGTVAITNEWVRAKLAIFWAETRMGRRETGKPLDPKSLRKHFALDIGTGAVEANFTVGRLILATILGSPPPPGTVAITNEWVRAKLAIFWAETRMGRRETGKPLDPKSLRKHFALDIGTGAVEANFTVGRLILATILGLPPPPGTVAITNERVRAKLAIFWAETRMGWRETSVDEHRGKSGYRKFYRPYP